jgi:hypothetical protein
MTWDVETVEGFTNSFFDDFFSGGRKYRWMERAAKPAVH